MANLNAPKGFSPVRYLNGATWDGSVNMYYVAQADANQINPGDAVKSVALSDANGVPGVTKITNGTDAARGVVVGCLVAPPYGQSLVGTTLDLAVQNIPATKTKAYYVLVVDDPNVLFEIQDNGLSVIGATSMSKNFSFTVTNPTAPQQNSASVLLNSSAAVTATLPLRLMGAVQRDDNDITSVNAKWLVKFNVHELGSVGTLGI